MSIIVTGGAGFIGSNFVLDWLQASREPVIILDKLTYAGNPENFATVRNDPAHQLVQGILVTLNWSAACWQSMLPGHSQFRSRIPRRSLHTRAWRIHSNEHRRHVPAAGSCPRILGRLTGAARGAFRFLHVSTDEVYGSLRQDEPAFTEAHQYQPNSPYSASKAASDHLVRAYHHTYGLPVLTTNCSNNYGPYHFPEKLIPLVIHNALADKPLPIYGNGQQIRDWLYVKDHCSAIRRVLEDGRPGETYNIGGWNEKPTLRSFTRFARCLMNSAPKGRAVVPPTDHFRKRPPGS